MSEERTVYRTCPLCEATCGLELTLNGDELTKVRGDEQDVFSKGFLCPKALALIDLENDPDRVRDPADPRERIVPRRVVGRSLRTRRGGPQAPAGRGS